MPLKSFISQKINKNILIVILVVASILLCSAAFILYTHMQGLTIQKLPRIIVSKLKTTTRKADLLITGVNYDEAVGETKSTIKFIEYDINGKTLEPLYFNFNGNIIQLQSLVMKFGTLKFKDSEVFKGKNAYLFWKIYLPEGKLTRKIELTKINSIPLAYKLRGEENPDEEVIWKHLWDHVLDPENPDNIAIKNIRIKAPGKIFIPGTMYKIILKDDGSMTLHASFLPDNPS